MIDNYSIFAESSAPLSASNWQLIFLVFHFFVGIDSIVTDLNIIFLNSKIVKVKMLLRRSPLFQLDLLDILSSQNFLFTSFRTFSGFFFKDVRKKRRFLKPLNYVHEFGLVFETQRYGILTISFFRSRLLSVNCLQKRYLAVAVISEHQYSVLGKEYSLVYRRLLQL